MSDNVIHVYTRADAIADGTLIDISKYTADNETTPLVKQAGFKFPIAMTSEAYSHVELPVDYIGYQSLTGRLWDVLFLLNFNIRSLSNRSEIFFDVLFMNNENKEDPHHDSVKFKALIGPGDDLEPVITIMLENQD